MSSGGVEPETVRLYRWRYEDWRTSWRCEWRPPLSPGGTEETAEFVPLSALRLVEEELRQAREGLAQAHDHITAMENGQHPSHTWVHPEDMPCPDGRHLRYVEHVTKLSWLTDWEWQRQRADRAETDRDRLAEELRQAREVAHSRLRDRARLVRRAERAEANLDLLIRRFALVSARSGMRAQALQLAEDCITENVANGEGVDSQPAVLDAIFDALKYEFADEPDGARPRCLLSRGNATHNQKEKTKWTTTI